MNEYFPEPKSLGRRVKVQLHFSNYATKTDSKIATGLDMSKFSKKIYLANLKFNVDKLDIDIDKLKNVSNDLSNLKSKKDKLDVDKLVSVPVDLSKLINVVKDDVVKTDVYNIKIKNAKDKISNIIILATNITPNAKINEGKKKKYLAFTNLATTIAYNAKINEVKNKIPNIANLAIGTALTDVENKIPITQKILKLKIK